MKNKKYIVMLGSSGFPYGLAGIQRIILISKCLQLNQNSVTVVCKKGMHNKADYPQLKEFGKYENIEYIYTSGYPFRCEKFLKRNLLKIRGIIKEIEFLKKRKNSNKLDYAIIWTRSFGSILYYTILSKLFGFKTVLSYVEYFSGVKKKWSRIGLTLNDLLFDMYAPILVDMVFPISEFLVNHLNKISPAIKQLKIPVLTDFDRYENIELVQNQKYFLFCGAANYKEIIQFIINSYNRLEDSSTYLYLVINGDEKQIIEIKNYINNSPQKDRIKVLSKLTEKELNSYYKNAIALLIPLRPTFQDIARFPHKIGEYMASGNPVISTNYGEVKHYFIDMKNMLIADSYNELLFANKMQFVLDNPNMAQKIGLNGKKMGYPIFDFRMQSNVLNDFLNSKS